MVVATVGNVLTVDTIVDVVDVADCTVVAGAVVASGYADGASDISFDVAGPAVSADGDGLDIELDPHLVVRSGPNVVVFGTRGCSLGGS